MNGIGKSVLVGLVGVGLSAIAIRSVRGQSFAFQRLRTPDEKLDLNRLWQALTTASWDLQDHPAQAQPRPWLQLGATGAIPPGQGVVEGNEIPYSPAAAARKKGKFENRINPATADPEAKCYLPGVPRATYLPYPFQIVQGTHRIQAVYGFADATRTIHMDKTNPEPVPIDSWVGRSHGAPRDGRDPSEKAL